MASNGPITAPRVIHRAMKAVHLPAIRLVRKIGEHRVARRAAYSLSDTIDESQREDTIHQPAMLMNGRAAADSE